MRRDVFRAIADPTRRAILMMLAKESLNLNSVVGKFKISRPAISKHIKILMECGLVEIEQLGRERYCKAQYDKIEEVSTWIAEYKHRCDNRSDALDNMLEDTNKINDMEDFILKDDIDVYCITAKSFPDKILEAHQSLHSLVEFNTERRYFGLSQPDENGRIIYKAAAEEIIPGELSKHHLEKFTIVKGTYHSILIQDFMNHIADIGKAFQEMIHLDTVAPDGLCIEWYLLNDNVRCMVRQHEV